MRRRVERGGRRGGGEGWLPRSGEKRGGGWRGVGREGREEKEGRKERMGRGGEGERTKHTNPSTKEPL
jgi:hypothetical protein